MEPAELAHKLRVLGQSPERLAEDLGVSGDTIREWQTGTRRVPARYARLIEWFAIAAEREAALAKSGLPECDWVSRWESTQELSDPEKELERLRVLEIHQNECPTCRARTAYLNKGFPALPDLPRTWAERALLPLVAIDERLRGGRRGVAIVVSVPLFLLMAWVLRLAPRSWPFEIVTYFVALGLALTSGIGLYRGLVLLHAFGAVGRWLARSVAGVVAMIGFGAVFTLANFGASLSPDGVAPSWSDNFWMGVVLGLAYASLWPLASAYYRNRGA